MSGFWETASKWGTAAFKVAEAVTRHNELVQLLSCDRESAMNLVAQMAATSPPQMFDEQEESFLQLASTSIVDPAQRRRALELYAWMKYCEAHRHGQFRGFPN